VCAEVSLTPDGYAKEAAGDDAGLYTVIVGTTCGEGVDEGRELFAFSRVEGWWDWLPRGGGGAVGAVEFRIYDEYCKKR